MQGGGNGSVLMLSCISVLCIFTAFCVLTLASGEGGKGGIDECSKMKIVCFKDRIEDAIT